MTPEQEALELRIACLDRAIQAREREIERMRFDLKGLMGDAVNLRREGRPQMWADAKAPVRPITDGDAMKRIHTILNGQEWGADAMQEIAELVTLTGREIGELNDDGAEVGE